LQSETAGARPKYDNRQTLYAGDSVEKISIKKKPQIHHLRCANCSRVASGVKTKVGIRAVGIGSGSNGQKFQTTGRITLGG